MIKFLVKGQDIETLEHEVIAADQVSFVNVKFAFDNNWKPLHKVVKFTQECEEYFRVLGVDGTNCYLPSELHPGAVKMSLFGYDPNATETVRATTVIHTLHVRESGFEGEGSTSVPPTPDLYQQLLQEIERGGDGKSAFEIAVENGYVGTVEQWLESLKGADGENGNDGTDGQPGADGKSAYEIAVENGYAGTMEQWLESLKGADGENGNDGTDGQSGADGKSAFEIAVEQGYTGTEEEWLTEMKPDMSNYYNKTEVTVLVERKIEPTQEKAHIHENKAILDSFTQADKTAIDSLPLFKQGINDDISELRESVSTVVEQAHWHHNLTVLNGITSAKIAKWDSATEWQLQFQTLQGNVMDYQMQMNHRMDEADETISAVDTAVQQLRDSNQYDHQNLSDEINLLTNRVTNLESELEEIDSILSRIVG